MKISFGGSYITGYIASGEYEPGIDPPLQPCPFCGSVDLMVANYLSVHYSIDCECGCSFELGEPGCTLYRYRNIQDAEAHHREVFLMAIETWNTRTSTIAPTENTTRPEVANT